MASYLAPIKEDELHMLVLRRHANGGWTVRTGPEVALISTDLGAFSSAAEMLVALNDALLPATGDVK